MLQIAGGILIAIGILTCIPILFRLIGPLVLAIIYIMAAPFMFYGWIKRKLFGEKNAKTIRSHTGQP